MKTGVLSSPSIVGRNIIINGGFTINQRVYVSAATLAATAFGHDRWKAGSGGGTYSFTQLASPTTITIAAGKTLIQVVEDKNVYGGSYILSWLGTAQARYAVNSATPAGSYAASPIIITGQNPGTTMSVEFNAGTLSNVQLELGSVATPFEFRPYGQELTLCKRYCSGWTSAVMWANTTSQLFGGNPFPTTMLNSPTIVIRGVGDGVNNRVNNIYSGAAVNIATLTIINNNRDAFLSIYDSGGAPFTATNGYYFAYLASVEP